MSKKAFTNLEGKIVEHINKLYISNRKTFLSLSKNGEYSTIKGTLHDGLIASHLRGNQTIGVFSGVEMSKFMCFDIDMTDKSKLKWVYYLLVESLSDIGLSRDHIHVATSGNKGLHVLIFVKDGTSLKHFKCLFVEVMKLIQTKVDTSLITKLINNNEIVLEIMDICNIEFRPSFTQGVKLEMGINFKSQNSKTNKCLFVDRETLKVINTPDYILSIQPMPKDEFISVIENPSDTYSETIEEHITQIKQNIKEPHSHKINKDENETIEYIVNLIQNGMYMSGTRHHSVLKIAKYFRYMGLELDQCIEELKKWMLWQDKKYYFTPLSESLLECERISKIVYDKEYSLVGHVENLKIYKSEMKEIINIENKYDKLLLYTMLLHSKRYSLKNGVFYMTYKQINEMSGISANGAITSMKRLEEMGYLEVVSRNVRQEKNYKHLPNRYMVNLNLDNDEIVLEIDNTSDTLNNNDLYLRSIIKAFTNEELTHLPNRQYREITKFRNSMVS